MRLAIDDLPFVSASRLRALGEIGPDDATASVTFPAGEVFTVGLSHIRFPNNGSWSFFICACGRRCRTLRLYAGALACKGCLEARGLRYEVEDMSPAERAGHVALRLKRRLISASPARLRPRPGRVLDRRERFRVGLWRAEYCAARRDFFGGGGDVVGSSGEGSGRLR
jgi:hypothetical protein